MGRNHPGTSSITNVALRVPDREALHYFAGRLAEHGVTPGEEDAAHLGERLSLPPFLEGRRERIEARLKPLERVHAANA